MRDNREYSGDDQYEDPEQSDVKVKEIRKHWEPSTNEKAVKLRQNNILS